MPPRPARKKKGPRNGPDPRGAGNLNRFRERLDGACVAGALVSRRPCFQPLVNLKAERTVREQFSGVKASWSNNVGNLWGSSETLKCLDF